MILQQWMNLKFMLSKQDKQQQKRVHIVLFHLHKILENSD